MLTIDHIIRASQLSIKTTTKLHSWYLSSSHGHLLLFISASESLSVNSFVIFKRSQFAEQGRRINDESLALKVGEILRFSVPFKNLPFCLRPRTNRYIFLFLLIFFYVFLKNIYIYIKLLRFLKKLCIF